MRNQLKLKNGTIVMDGFDTIKGKVAYFAMYAGGITIHEKIKEDRDYYYRVLVEDVIKDDILYMLLERRGITEEDFVYLQNANAYFELEPKRDKYEGIKKEPEA